MRKPAATLFILGALLVTAGVGLLLYALNSAAPASNSSDGGANHPQTASGEIEIAAANLDIPWKVVELPGGQLLVTERSGTLKRIGADQKTYPIRGVSHTSEGGLLGLALHPRFAENKWLYVYLTTGSGGSITNRVERYRYASDELTGRKVIIDDIPGAQNHDGGALAFGPDGLLYVSTGDAQDESSAQNTGALSGKILRLTDEGTVPPDNPFGNEVYSYGHRNPQGLAWDDRGRLWATEHGRSGIRSGYDELNLINSGGNYGWPIIQGDEERPGMIRPAVHSGANDTWAPSGLAYADGSLYFGGLRGRALFKAKLGPDGAVTISKHLENKYGRLRGVTAVQGNTLLVTTSNRDGRGDPADDDDKVLRVMIAQ